jgi:hypothetical protein
LVERLVEREYQVCLIDPEGDYDDFDALTTLGGPNHLPDFSEVIESLNTQNHSMSVNLLGAQLADRPSFFQGLLSRIQELRSKTGRPHWIVLDEAHHLLPAALDSVKLTMPRELASLALITVHPDHVSQAILASINGIVAVGPQPRSVVAQFSSSAGADLNIGLVHTNSAEAGEIVVWLFAAQSNPMLVNLTPAKAELKRHKRKYAAGELGEDKSFYFRGPAGALNLRAQNMNFFAQIAEGIDEETWRFHRAQSDYSHWLRESIKDQTLADTVAGIEADSALTAAQSRRLIIDLIRKHYTAPA